MRCRHCAGEVPPGSRFCPICGRPLDAGASPTPGPDPGSMSLFELPVSRGARRARVAVVLVLDLVLAGAGIAMILSYLDDRAAAAARAPEPVVELEVPEADVDALEPEPVDVEDVKREPSKPARKVVRKKRPPPKRAPAESDPEPDPDPDPVSDPAPDAAPRPDPTEDEGLIEDDIDESERVESMARRVRREVDRHQVQLSKCYQHATKQSSPSKPLQGRVDIQFVIMPDGTATSVRPVANTTGSDQLADCVKGLIESWAFPSPGAEEMAFVWPFVFKAP